MGDLKPQSTIQHAIWTGRLYNTNPFSDNLQFNDYVQTGGLPNFNKRYNATGTLNGLRTGVPNNGDEDMYYYQEHDLRPYIKGMSPYPTTNMVDIVPSSYNTNPMGGNGGYEANLASTNGFRPLSSALDDIDQFEQRLYDDRYRISSTNPLSAQFAQDAVLATINNDNNQFYNPKFQRLQQDMQNDQITKLKIQSGHYDTPIIGQLSAAKQKEFDQYYRKQRPINAEDLKSTADNIYDNFNTSLIGNKSEIINGMDLIRKELQENAKYNRQSAGQFTTTPSSINIPSSDAFTQRKNKNFQTSYNYNYNHPPTKDRANELLGNILQTSSAPEGNVAASIGSGIPLGLTTVFPTQPSGKSSGRRPSPARFTRPRETTPPQEPRPSTQSPRTQQLYPLADPSQPYTFRSQLESLEALRARERERTRLSFL